jgi:hypothetical protein
MTTTKKQFTENQVTKEMLDTIIARQDETNTSRAKWKELQNDEFQYIYEVGIETNSNGKLHWFDVEITADNISVEFKNSYSMNTGKMQGQSPRAVAHKLKVTNKIRKHFNKNFGE